MLNNHLDQEANEFKCPISGEIMIDPVIAGDDQTYERENIEKHFLTSPLSPLTRQSIRHIELKPNRAIKSLIDKLLIGKDKQYYRSKVYLPKKYITDLLSALEKNSLIDLQNLISKNIPILQDDRLLDEALIDNHQLTIFHLACLDDKVLREYLPLPNIKRQNSTKIDKNPSVESNEYLENRFKIIDYLIKKIVEKNLLKQMILISEKYFRSRPEAMYYLNQYILRKIEEILESEKSCKKLITNEIDTLMKLGANIVKARNKKGKSILHLYAEKVSIEEIHGLSIHSKMETQELMELGELVERNLSESNSEMLSFFNAEDLETKTALHYACANQKYEYAKFLLQRGAKANFRDKLDKTALDYTIEDLCKIKYNEVLDQIVDLLIVYNASINFINKDGLSYLDLAIINGNLRLVKFLIERNIILFSPSYVSPLQAAVKLNKKQIVEYILKEKIVNTYNNELHLALENKNLEILKMLLDYGYISYINNEDEKGRTPLTIAFETGQRDMAVALISKGADYSKLEEKAAKSDKNSPQYEIYMEILAAKQRIPRQIFELSKAVAEYDSQIMNLKNTIKNLVDINMRLFDFITCSVDDSKKEEYSQLVLKLTDVKVTNKLGSDNNFNLTINNSNSNSNSNIETITSDPNQKKQGFFSKGLSFHRCKPSNQNYKPDDKNDNDNTKKSLNK